jgi:hypothetical protein
MLIAIPVKNKQEVQFWIRAFQLEGEIAKVTALLSEKQERKTAFSPIIAEHFAGDYRYAFLLGVRIDVLGLVDGTGLVWLTSTKAHFDAAVKKRNEFANEILKEAESSGKFDEIVEFNPHHDK